MTPDFANIQIYVKPGITDMCQQRLKSSCRNFNSVVHNMRKQVNGLSIIAEEEMGLNPGTGNLFLFCSRDKKLLKSIWWDKNGFCLFQKRLEKGKHPWPDTEEQAKELDSGQLKMLLDGIDFWNAHEPLCYQEIS